MLRGVRGSCWLLLPRPPQPCPFSGCCRGRNQLRNGNHKAQSPRGGPARRRRGGARRRSPELGGNPLCLLLQPPGDPALPGPQGSQPPRRRGPGPECSASFLGLIRIPGATAPGLHFPWASALSWGCPQRTLGGAWGHLWSPPEGAPGIDWVSGAVGSGHVPAAVRCIQSACFN